MTAYTSSDVDFTYINQEGNFSEYVLHLDRLANADTLDLTPYVQTGQKACFVQSEDHAATITSGNTTGTSTTSQWHNSMVVSTDIVTFRGGPSSFDVHVSFKVVPGR